MTVTRIEAVSSHFHAPGRSYRHYRQTMLRSCLPAQAKAKYKVYIDGQFVFVLYKGELSRYRLAEGSLIEEEVSPSFEIPLPNMMSNSASLNGGAILFFTIFTRVLFPIISLPEKEISK